MKYYVRIENVERTFLYKFLFLEKVELVFIYFLLRRFRILHLRVVFAIFWPE